MYVSYFVKIYRKDVWSRTMQSNRIFRIGNSIFLTIQNVENIENGSHNENIENFCLHAHVRVNKLYIQYGTICGAYECARRRGRPDLEVGASGRWVGGGGGRRDGTFLAVRRSSVSTRVCTTRTSRKLAAPWTTSHGIQQMHFGLPCHHYFDSDQYVHNIVNFWSYIRI